MQITAKTLNRRNRVKSEGNEDVKLLNCKLYTLDCNVQTI